MEIVGMDNEVRLQLKKDDVSKALLLHYWSGEGNNSLCFLPLFLEYLIRILSKSFNS